MWTYKRLSVVMLALEVLPSVVAAGLLVGIGFRLRQCALDAWDWPIMLCSVMAGWHLMDAFKMVGQYRKDRTKFFQRRGYPDEQVKALGGE